MNIADFYSQKKIQDGDIREFEKLFVKYFDPLCRTSYKIVKDMATAEDIVQEFFYQFWKNRDSFSPKLSLNAYLHHSIHNNSLHYLEHLEVRKTYADFKVSETKDSDSFEYQHNIEMKDLKKVINATLQLMPERCSMIFRMNRFEGKKYREIADYLGISVKTVEADMGKALQLFRTSLREFKQQK